MKSKLTLTLDLDVFVEHHDCRTNEDLAYEIGQSLQRVGRSIDGDDLDGRGFQFTADIDDTDAPMAGKVLFS